MTAEKRNAIVAEREMRKIVENPADPEGGHSEADRLLVRVLRMQGFHDLCDLYERVEKWYA